MNKTTQISIKEPCSENWENMTPNEQGRFCQSCQKSVVDIQSWSDEKLLNFLAESKGQSCIKASKQQLDRPLVNSKVRKEYSKSLWAYTLALLAMPSGFSFGQERQSYSPTYVTANLFEEEPVIKDSGVIIISGFVLDSLYDNEAMIGATVLIRGTECGTVSNLDGYFSLEIDTNKYSIDSLVIELNYVGFEKKYYPLSTLDLSKDLTLYLSEAVTRVYNGDIIVVGKPSVVGVPRIVGSVTVISRVSDRHPRRSKFIRFLKFWK